MKPIIWKCFLILMAMVLMTIAIEALDIQEKGIVSTDPHKFSKKDDGVPETEDKKKVKPTNSNATTGMNNSTSEPANPQSPNRLTRESESVADQSQKQVNTELEAQPLVPDDYKKQETQNTEDKAMNNPAIEPEVEKNTPGPEAVRQDPTKSDENVTNEQHDQNKHKENNEVSPVAQTGTNPNPQGSNEPQSQIPQNPSENKQESNLPEQQQQEEKNKVNEDHTQLPQDNNNSPNAQKSETGGINVQPEPSSQDPVPGASSISQSSIAAVVVICAVAIIATGSVVYIVRRRRYYEGVSSPMGSSPGNHSLFPRKNHREV